MTRSTPEKKGPKAPAAPVRLTTLMTALMTAR